VSAWLSRLRRGTRARTDLKVEAESIVWFHSLDLGHGVVTDGVKSPELLAHELAAMQLPDLEGRTVLDVGAWDGYFSFAAEQQGARRVVALDHYVWQMDLHAQRDYGVDCHARGEAPSPFEEVPELWHPDMLPGKRGFDLAHRCYSSRVEELVADFMTMDISDLGRFDVVFFRGVLYHLQDPLGGLKRLRAVTGELAVVETEAACFRGLDDRCMCEFYPGAELAGDPTTWWVPNGRALVGLLLAAGFSRAELVVEPTAHLDHHYRAVAHAWR